MPEQLGDFVEFTLTNALTETQMIEGLKSLNHFFGTPLNPSALFLIAASKKMLEHAIPLPSELELSDTCGTGGDNKHLFNISSLAALTVVSCGLCVAKHGNRAVSGSFGSADFFEKIGIPIHKTPHASIESLNKNGFSFLFAPLYHPAMKHAAIARKKIGQRTIFNCLGPLINPSRPKHQTIGVYDEGLMRPMLEASVHLGVKNISIVHASDGSDEVATWCSTKVLHTKDSNLRQIQETIIEPKQFKIESPSIKMFQCNSPEDAMRMADQVIEGKKGKFVDLIALNAAITLWTAGAAKDIPSALEIARSHICKGDIAILLNQLKSNE